MLRPKKGRLERCAESTLGTAAPHLITFWHLTAEGSKKITLLIHANAGKINEFSDVYTNAYSKEILLKTQLTGPRHLSFYFGVVYL